MNGLVRAGYRESERITRERARSFAFASSALGADLKRASFAVYAFCRRCDDAVDSAEGLAAQQLAARVADLRAQVADAYRGEDRGDPVLAAFGDTVRAHAVPRQAVLELIDGMEQDLTTKRYETWDELLVYCDLAAGTVGRMMASVFGVTQISALEHASALGCAMQLTNVLRDVAEDALVHDRVYLPRIALAQAGIDDARLAAWARAGSLDASAEAEAMRGVMREAGRRASALYEKADEGVPYIVVASGRACVRLMRATYSEILSVLAARGWDPFAGRASTSLPRKLRVGARALIGAWS